MATHSSPLAWEIPWTEEGCSPGVALVGYSLWGRKESDRTEQLNTPDTPTSLQVSELQCPQL